MGDEARRVPRKQAPCARTGASAGPARGGSGAGSRIAMDSAAAPKDARRPGEAIGMAGGMESPAFFVMASGSRRHAEIVRINRTVGI